MIASLAGVFTTSPAERLAGREANATSITAFITVCNQRIKWEEQSGEKKAARRLKRSCDVGLGDLDAARQLGAQVPGGPVGAAQGTHLPASQRRVIARLVRQAAAAPAAYVTASDLAAEGAAYLLLGDNRRALDKLNRALQKRPDSAVLLNNRGVALLALGQPLLAERDFKAALARRPHDTTILGNYAFGSVSAGATKVVGTDLLAQLSKSDDPKLLFAGGAVLSRTPDLQAALTALNKTLTLDPSDVQAVAERAVVWAKLDRGAKAAETFAKLLSAVPARSQSSAGIYYDYARYWVVEGDHPRALDWLSRSIADNDAYKVLAAGDSDFFTLRGEPRFVTLTRHVPLGKVPTTIGKPLFPPSP